MNPDDEVVGVTITSAPDGAPEAVVQITRTDAVAARFAFEAALIVGDVQSLRMLVDEIDQHVAENPAADQVALFQKAFLVMLNSVVGPALNALEPHAADHLRMTFRACASEFRSMTN